MTAPPQAGTPRPKTVSRWALRLAGGLWTAATVTAVAIPPLALYMLHSQYMSLINNTTKVSEIVEFVDRTETTHEYTELTRTILEAVTYSPEDIPIWVTVTGTVFYSLLTLMTVAVCIPIARATSKGANWGRITGTILAVPASLLVISLWLSILEISWLPVKALSLNTAGLLITAAYLTGIVLAFLPVSNRYVKQKASETKTVTSPKSML